ncbi:hypothetical protein L484_006938 [Morus notabilis]|uniref:Uncharacterized protein n=1 Tax=Morus notabilis TaxID=981085 RepID=W9QKJ9_9ROSA|nr:hypothetical protein L484_006938 [Morus notabilis]
MHPLRQPSLFFMSFFLKGLRFITPKAFSELLKLSREYQMLTVTKVTDFRWTRSREGVLDESVCLPPSYGYQHAGNVPSLLYGYP